MYYPNIKDFVELSKKGNLIPVYKEIPADTETPVTAYMKVDSPNSFLLESVVGGEKWARYSILGVAPRKIFKSWGKDVEVIEGGRSTNVSVDDPIGELKKELAPFHPVGYEGIPRFSGGLVGYIGYENVSFFEKISISNKPSLAVPDIFVMFMDTILIFDNLKQVIKVVANAYLDGENTPEETYEQTTRRVDRLARIFDTGTDLRKLCLSCDPADLQFTSTFTRKDDFIDAVEKAKEYIRAGDIFQVVLSQRFGIEQDVNPFSIYRALRVINPSPYMFYLNMDDFKLVGSSPEILVRLEDGRVILRPIAGTRKRGASQEEDASLEEELKNDPKERAEHIMLVDLGRNDVGRVAATGSVRVTEMMAVEKYSHVMHMVSNVEGDLKKGLDAFDVLRACFPAGTVTGAPKVRAMEIIEELEPVMRGPYAGAVGYFSFSGNMDMCITIRTLIIKDGKIYIQAGAGIVSDSVADLEYAECLNKARGMMRAVAIAKAGSR